MFMAMRASNDMGGEASSAGPSNSPGQTVLRSSLFCLLRAVTLNYVALVRAVLRFVGADCLCVARGRTQIVRSSDGRGCGRRRIVVHVQVVLPFLQAF